MRASGARRCYDACTTQRDETAGRDRDELPPVVQIVGRAFAEEEVLAVANLLEDALGGFKRPPQ
jgi:hypothetical protein